VGVCDKKSDFGGVLSSGFQFDGWRIDPAIARLATSRFAILLFGDLACAGATALRLGASSGTGLRPGIHTTAAGFDSSTGTARRDDEFTPLNQIVILSTVNHELNEPLNTDDEMDINEGGRVWPGTRFRSAIRARNSVLAHQ